MADERFGISEVDQPLEQLDPVEHVDACPVAARRAESDDRRIVTAQQLLGQFVLWIVFEPRPPYPRDALVLSEPTRHGRSVLLVPFTSEGKCLETLQQQKGIERRQCCTFVAHAD